MSNFLKIGEGVSFVKLASAPSSPSEGDVYYDSTLDQLRFYDGTQWVDTGGGGSGGGSIGDPVTGGNTGSVLFVDSSGNLAQDAGLTYDPTTDTLDIVNLDVAASGSIILQGDVASREITISAGNTAAPYNMILPLTAPANNEALVHVSGGQFDFLNPSDITFSAYSSNGVVVSSGDTARIAIQKLDARVNAAPINYIENGLAAQNTDGWTLDTLNGNLSFARNTTTPLRGSADFLITKLGSTANDDNVFYAFTINPADRAKVLTISFDYKSAGNFKYNAGTLSDPSDLIVIVTNLNTLEEVPVSNSFLDGSGKYLATFQTDATSTNYKVSLFVATANALSWTFNFTNLKVGPSIISTAAVVTDLVNYTPTVSNTTNVNVRTAYWRRVGDSLEVRGYIGWSGTGAGAAFTVSLPSGLSIDTNKTSSIVTETSLGYLQFKDSGVSYRAGNVVYDSTTAVKFVLDSATDALLGTGFTVSDSLFFTFTVPIAGWSSNVKISSDYGNRVIAANLNRNGVNQTNLAPNNSFVKVVLNSASVDTVAGFDSVNNRYTVRETGYYNLSGLVTIQGTNVTNTFHTVAIYRNGSVLVRGAAQVPPAGQSFALPVSADGIFLTAGDFLELFIYSAGNNSVNNLTAFGANSETFLTVTKIQSPQTLAGGEVVAYQGNNSAGTSVTTSFTTIPFTTVSDTHNSFVTNTYTVPVSGFYNITAFLATVGINLATSQYLQIQLLVSGNIVARTSIKGSGVLAEQSINITKMQYITQGSTITVQATSSVGTTLSTNPVQNWLSISKVN